MAITYHTQDCSYIFKDKRKMNSVLRRCVAEEGFRLGDISVIFCSDTVMLDLNNRYLGHNYHTDIITFDYGGEGTAGGDLFIGVDTVADNAVSIGVDPKDEMRRVVIHGVLHLCGYGDKSDAEAVLMREKEDCYLRYLL